MATSDLSDPGLRVAISRRYGVWGVATSASGIVDWIMDSRRYGKTTLTQAPNSLRMS
jgi:hypothetical protein